MLKYLLAPHWHYVNIYAMLYWLLYENAQRYIAYIFQMQIKDMPNFISIIRQITINTY